MGVENDRRLPIIALSPLYAKSMDNDDIMSSIKKADPEAAKLVKQKDLEVLKNKVKVSMRPVITRHQRDNNNNNNNNR